MKKLKGNSADLFSSAPIPKAVLVNVIPSIISMIMVLIYNLADTFFIGKTNNAAMINGVAFVTPAFMVFMAIGMLFGVGGTSFISRKLGEGDSKIVKKVSSFCFWAGIAIGVLALILIWIFINPLCSLIGAKSSKTDAETIAYTKSYFKILSIGLPFLIMSSAFSNIIRAEGKVNVAMIGNIVGNILNIILDPIMILGFNWGITGAAVATVIGNVAAAVYYFIHLVSKRTIFSIKPRDFCAKEGIASNVFKIGIPASLNSMLMSISMIVANNLMTSINPNAVGALGVALKVNMITVMLLIGLGTGIQPLLGYCFGARNEKRFTGVIKFSLLCAVILSVVMSLISYFAAGALVKAFIETPDQSTLGSQFVKILVISGPILGILFVFINALQAMGAAVPSLILSASRQGIIYIPLLLIFNAIAKTEVMLVLAQPITDYIATVLSIVLFIVVYKKFKKSCQADPKEQIDEKATEGETQA